ncbi:fructosyl amine:oxygen oxidoreductase [Talaromyces islandicus]|uniref:Fructosyl amine:oxygen oxidoreductase n=1 Tax=Talaromyces islandicus TaxID=28573 RepID=A0A0U1LYP0_TALIS|nr:fructosyl amine:oxygen oxidoreductase [Talaromyces islandicus]
MSEVTHKSVILIVGGGTWGCSIALELARRGYQDITVLDAHPIPAPIAAGNDLNKIIEEGSPSVSDSDENYVWNRMHQLSTKAWKTDSVYQKFYHSTGFIMAASQKDARHEVDAYMSSCKDRVRLLTSPSEFQNTMPNGILTGPFPNWKGVFREKGAGWAFARGALEAARHEAARLGVRFLTGVIKGNVQRLLYSSTDIIGAQTAEGREHRADRTILCAGANSDQLFDFERQLRPTAWTLAHIQMTDEERALWKGLPVLFNEPDEQNGELKLVDEHPGYCNFIKDPETGNEKSVPFAKKQIPVQSEQKARQFLRETVPQIADRLFSFARVCWDADTPDRQFLIDQHPKYKSLVVAVGGSGNGFMMMPAVGMAVADVIDGVIESRLKHSFRWRPETAVDRDWRDTQHRFGGDGTVRDFQKVREWTAIGESS